MQRPAWLVGRRERGAERQVEAQDETLNGMQNEGGPQPVGSGEPVCLPGAADALKWFLVLVCFFQCYISDIQKTFKRSHSQLSCSRHRLRRKNSPADVRPGPCLFLHSLGLLRVRLGARDSTMTLSFCCLFDGGITYTQHSVPISIV